MGWAGYPQAVAVDLVMAFVTLILLALVGLRLNSETAYIANRHSAGLLGTKM